MKNIIFDPPTSFAFTPGDYVPFKDREVCERLRKISGKDLEKHANPDFKIKVMQNPHPVLIATLFERIRAASEAGKKITLILGNPEPETYIPLAQLINYFKVDCSKVHLVAEDEWADQDGNIAPITYKAGFSYSQLKYFYGKIDEDLRMPLEQVHYPTTENINHYSDMLHEDGDADICYSGPGWAGHIAFIDPMTPEFGTPSVEEYLKMGARVVTLNPMTIMQNSLHGVFGQSGDIASVPPRAATIGPLDVARAKNRMECHALTTAGSFSSWQRMISRLILQGEVTPLVPASILQLMPTMVYVSEGIAQPIECMETVGY